MITGRIVLDDQDGDAEVTTDALNEFRHLGFFAGAHACHWLVEQEEVAAQLGLMATEDAAEGSELLRKAAGAVQRPLSLTYWPPACLPFSSASGVQNAMHRGPADRQSRSGWSAFRTRPDRA
jgi:hypothetical protein